jgi:tetratricopeptide (TPR) repeat protein
MLPRRRMPLQLPRRRNMGEKALMRQIIAGLLPLALAGCATAPVAEPPALEAAAEVPTTQDVFNGLRSADCRPFLAKAAEIARSPAFEADEPTEEQVVFLWQIANCAMEQKQYQVAFDHAERATRLKSDIVWLQVIRLYLGMSLDRPDASLDALNVLSRVGPEEVRGADLEIVGDLLREAHEADPDGDMELAAHEALERVAYVPTAPYFDDFLKIGHGRLLLERNRVAEARDRLVGIVDIDFVVEMRVDRLYDPLRGDPAFEAQLDVAVAAERDVARSREAMMSNPRLMEAVYIHSKVLLAAMRYQEGLVAVQDALNRDEADRDAFTDGDEFRNWLVNLRGYLLYNIGRVDEGRAVLQEAAGMRERGDVNVSNIINYGGYLLLERRAKEAYDLLPRIGDPSPYGKGWIEEIRACAGAQLGDADLERAGLEYLEAHESDNPPARTRALLCANDLDAAAAQMIRRLKNRETRLHALLALQITPPRSDVGLPHRKFLDDQYAALRARPDVLAVALSVGRIEKFPFFPGSETN